jgi:Flp pilus assembly protein TadG
MMKRLLKRWWKEEDALAATEAAMIFPIMLTLLMGVFDVGNGILANQKAIRASQVVADLIARDSIATATDIQEAVEAGRLAFEPLNALSYGVDIVSVRFDENSDPEIVWRETENMTPVSNVMERVDPLAAPDEGVVMVAVKYVFEPLFVGFVAHEIVMQEVGFSRGRKSAVVNTEG